MNSTLLEEKTLDQGCKVKKLRTLDATFIFTVPRKVLTLE